MASQTLAQAALLVENPIIRGIAEDIMTPNAFFRFLPFFGYRGAGFIVPRELTLGDADFYEVDDTITHKTPGTYSQAVFTATKIIGDVEMDKLLEGQQKSMGVSQLAYEISSKSKTISRKYQEGMANGTGTPPQMNSLASMIDSEQYVEASAGRSISFPLLRKLKAKVLAKDGNVDWIMCNGRTLLSIRALYDALGGTTPMHIVKLPNGQEQRVCMFEDTPIFQNDWIPITETANGAASTGGELTSVWAGVFDDGTKKVGVAGIYPEEFPAGIATENVGTMENKDSSLVRIKWYANFACFNRRGLARLASINN